MTKGTNEIILFTNEKYRGTIHMTCIRRDSGTNRQRRQLDLPGRSGFRRRSLCLIGAVRNSVRLSKARHEFTTASVVLCTMAVFWPALTGFLFWQCRWE